MYSYSYIANCLLIFSSTCTHNCLVIFVFACTYLHKINVMWLCVFPYHSVHSYIVFCMQYMYMSYATHIYIDTLHI